MNVPCAVLILALASPTVQPRNAPASAPPYDRFVIIPLRAHILKAPDLALADCRLTEPEVVRAIGKVNAIWHDAGVHFGLESVLVETAVQRTRFRLTSELQQGEIRPAMVRMLMPRTSRNFDGFHAYFFRELPSHINGGYQCDDAVIVQEGARLMQVPGGTDDPVSRVVAHALGYALGLSDHNDPGNLMANGTSGVALEAAQAEAARKVAQAVRGALTVAEVRMAAEEAQAGGDVAGARRLWTWLAEIPGAGAAAARRRLDAIEKSLLP